MRSKRATFLNVIHKLILYQFLKDFPNKARSLTFLNTGHIVTFQQSGKQDSFKHIWKRSVNLYESSGSDFFRTTTRIQSGPDALDESRLVMTCLINLGV